MSLRRVSLGYKVRPCPIPTSPPTKKTITITKPTKIKALCDKTRPGERLPQPHPRLHVTHQGWGWG